MAPRMPCRSAPPPCGPQQGLCLQRVMDRSAEHPGRLWLVLGMPTRSSPTRVASVLYLSPAVTMVWAWLMFAKPLSWAIAAGLALSGVGITLVIRGERHRPVRLPMQALQRN
jgi:hypothetical protein